MLINYLPLFLQTIKDYQQLFNSLDIELKNANKHLEYIVKDANILEADEDRITQWEEFLRIEKNGDLQQRKLYIIATLTTVGKLNKTKIQEIVNIYTNGGGADVSFKNSIITVKVKPPKGNHNFRFDDIKRTLEIMIPAHLGLTVVRFYALWSTIKNDFTSWQDVMNNLQTWEDVRLYTGVIRKKQKLNQKGGKH